MTTLNTLAIINSSNSERFELWLYASLAESVARIRFRQSPVRENHTMTFAVDLPAAARRHLLAADSLAGGGPRRDVAGYLYGIAAECAIKAMMRDAGVRTTSEAEDPYYVHFPKLRTLLRDAPLGRRGITLMHYINDDRFMNQWSTAMRYSRGKDILDRWITAWAEQAHQGVAAIGT